MVYNRLLIVSICLSLENKTYTWAVPEEMNNLLLMFGGLRTEDALQLCILIPKKNIFDVASICRHCEDFIWSPLYPAVQNNSDTKSAIVKNYFYTAFT